MTDAFKNMYKVSNVQIIRLDCWERLIKNTNNMCDANKTKG